MSLIRRRISSRRLWQAGDTLIEVTLALAILSVVLLSTTVVTTRAFQTGSTARERTELLAQAQAQLESVRGFRDSNTWEKFLYGSTVAPAFRGVLSDNTSSDCEKVAPCSHMEMDDHVHDYVPQVGKTVGTVPTSYIEITFTPVPAADPREVEVVVSYGFEGLGSGSANEGHIKTKFTNMQFNSPTGDALLVAAPGGAPGCLSSPTPWPACWTAFVINGSTNDPSIVSQCTLDWDDGSPTQVYAGSSPQCQNGFWFTHVYPETAHIPHTSNFFVRLTNYFNNGAPNAVFQFHITNIPY